LILPIGELCRRARERGLLVVVDGAHAPGQLPIELGALDADAYAGNCHKWLCAPKGAGFLWVRRELQPSVDSLVVGWGWADEQAGFVERNQRDGTRDPAAYLAVPAAIDFQAGRGWDDVRARCHALAVEALAGLADVGAQPLAGDESWFGQMVSVVLPPCDAETLALRLAHEHSIEVYGKEWNGRPVMRVSFQGYNSASDLERLLEVLPHVLPA
jgi:isopenicillin-N epimerase